MDAILVADLLGLGQCSGPAIDAAMHPAPFDSIGRLRPFPLHPFEIGEPRAILELIDHPRRQVRLIRAERRGREGEFGLLVHSRVGRSSGASGLERRGSTFRYSAVILYSPIDRDLSSSGGLFGSHINVCFNQPQQAEPYPFDDDRASPQGGGSI
jgi:hypothetical protein